MSNSLLLNFTGYCDKHIHPFVDSSEVLENLGSVAFIKRWLLDESTFPFILQPPY